MKKYAIILDNIIVHKYEALSPIPFGGAWGSPYAYHVEYPNHYEDIYFEELEESSNYLPDFLEGAETKEVILSPAVEEEICEETGEVLQYAKAAETQTLYLHPAYLIKEDRSRIDSLQYQIELVHQKRRAEYPPIEDYVDAIVKDDAEQMQQYIDACLAVKEKYPLPEKE